MGYSEALTDGDERDGHEEEGGQDKGATPEAIDHDHVGDHPPKLRQGREARQPDRQGLAETWG